MWSGHRLRRPSPSRYPRARIFFSTATWLTWLVATTLAVPLRVDALADATPGNEVKALTMRRSQAGQVIPDTETVRTSPAGWLPCLVPSDFV